MRGIGVAAECGANAVEFVGSDSSADAAAANQQANFGIAVLNGLADLYSVVTIIVRDGAVVSPEVDQIVAQFAQLFDNPLVEWVTSMIRADRYSHGGSIAVIHRLRRLFLCNLWIS